MSSYGSVSRLKFVIVTFPEWFLFYFLYRYLSVQIMNKHLITNRNRKFIHGKTMEDLFQYVRIM